MSLYQQQQGYGHSAYGFAQQTPLQVLPQYSYHAQHYPQPSYIMDASSFRRDYAARLSELTFNSRPIIQNLSIIAQEFTRFADIVTQCLEAHIRRVPPWMKLPAFYLLDAISKNVFEPYAAKFSAFVVSLFLETYHQVDHATRNKMDEMLATWRTGGPHGKELFGVAVQVAIERSIWGGDNSNMGASSSRRTHATVPITKSQVLAELEVTLAQKERQLAVNPYDSTSQTHVNVLQQLRKMVEAGVSQEELSQILAQLRALANDAASAPPPTMLPAFSNVPSQPLPPPVASVPYQSSYQSQATSFPHVLYGQSQISQSNAPLNDSASAPQSAANISHMLNSLLKAGLVSASQSTTVTSKFDVPIDKSDSDPHVEASREYAKTIFKKKIKLTTSDISRQDPFMVAIMHESLPVQCKQCAIRFSDSTMGRKKMEDHLDMHFRQNRKAGENVGRGHSRSWYLNLESWINDASSEAKGKGRADNSSMNSKIAEEEETLRSSFVLIPPGDEAKSILCPVCKEILKSEFLEEDEEWVWRNAVRVKDKIYHATCRAEMAASAALAAKLRDEARSRSGTPEITDSSRSTPPVKHLALAHSNLKTNLRASESPTPERQLVGSKRKVDDTQIGETTESTPPSKKLAV